MNASKSTSLPLEGIRVVEMTHMVMGPTCGMILADLGAEVIKVEPITGDKTRELLGAGAGFFRTFNRNKKSISVDMKDPQAVEAVLKLVDSADVFVENFKPGRMASMGFGYESLKARNPGLIYVSHKGFLQGPYDKRLALDEVVQMMAGLAYMTGPVGRPLRAGTSVNDIMGGMFGALGVLAALFQRQGSGQGKEIQSALFENCVLLSAQHMQQYAVTGVAANPMPERISAWGIYDTFETAGGRLMFIAATGDTPWKELCDILQRDDLYQDPRLATNNNRVIARPWLIPELANTIRHLDAEALAPVFEARQIPFAYITKPEELFDDPHLQQSGGLGRQVLEDGTETPMPLLPISIDGERLQPRQPIARIGEHTESVLRDLGYDAAEIDRLAAAGVLKVA